MSNYNKNKYTKEGLNTRENFNDKKGVKDESSQLNKTEDIPKVKVEDKNKYDFSMVNNNNEEKATKNKIKKI